MSRVKSPTPKAQKNQSQNRRPTHIITSLVLSSQPRFLAYTLRPTTTPTPTKINILDGILCCIVFNDKFLSSSFLLPYSSPYPQSTELFCLLVVCSGNATSRNSYIISFADALASEINIISLSMSRTVYGSCRLIYFVFR